MAVTQAQVAQLYVALFNRAPEGAGFNAWVAAGATKTVAQMANEMLASPATPPYFASLGIDISTDRGYVENIYKNILGKDYSQDPDGINAWVRHLQLGNSRGDTLVKLFEVATSAEARAADPVAAQTFANKTAISQYAAQKIADIPTDENGAYDFSLFQRIIAQTNNTNLDAQKAAIDALVAPTVHNLSSDANNVSGTDKGDVFNGAVSATVNQTTFKDTDKIDGKGGNDTLNLDMYTNFYGLANDRGEVKNIENLKLTNHTSGHLTFNARNIHDMQTISIEGSTYKYGVDIINPENKVKLNLKNIDLSQTGARTVKLIYNTDVLAGTNDDQEVTVDNVKTGNNKINITTVNNDKVEAVTINAVGGASKLTGFISDHTGGTEDRSIKTIKVKGSADLEITAPDSLMTFDASAYTGNKLTANLKANGGVQHIIGSSQDDTFNVTGASGAIIPINGGAGRDVVNILNTISGNKHVEMTGVEELNIKATAAVLDFSRAQEIDTLGISGTGTVEVEILNSKIKSVNVNATDASAIETIKIHSPELEKFNVIKARKAAIEANGTQKIDAIVKSDTRVEELTVISNTIKEANIAIEKVGDTTGTIASTVSTSGSLETLNVINKTPKAITQYVDDFLVVDGQYLNARHLKTLNIDTKGTFSFASLYGHRQLSAISQINIKSTGDDTMVAFVNLGAKKYAGDPYQGTQDINLNSEGVYNLFVAGYEDILTTRDVNLTSVTDKQSASVTYGKIGDTTNKINNLTLNATGQKTLKVGNVYANGDVNLTTKFTQEGSSARYGTPSTGSTIVNAITAKNLTLNHNANADILDGIVKLNGHLNLTGNLTVNASGYKELKMSTEDDGVYSPPYHFPYSWEKITVAGNAVISTVATTAGAIAQVGSMRLGPGAVDYAFKAKTITINASAAEDIRDSAIKYGHMISAGGDININATNQKSIELSMVLVDGRAQVDRGSVNINTHTNIDDSSVAIKDRLVSTKDINLKFYGQEDLQTRSMHTADGGINIDIKGNGRDATARFGTISSDSQNGTKKDVIIRLNDLKSFRASNITAYKGDVTIDTGTHNYMQTVQLSSISGRKVTLELSNVTQPINSFSIGFDTDLTINAYGGGFANNIRMVGNLVTNPSKYFTANITNVKGELTGAATTEHMVLKGTITNPDSITANGGNSNLLVNLTYLNNIKIVDLSGYNNPSGINEFRTSTNNIKLTTIKGSTTKDAITINSTNLKLIDTGAGDDTVTFNATQTHDITVNLGAGNDTITTAALTANKKFEISGGAGNDKFKLAASITTDNTASKYVTITDASRGDKIGLSDSVTGFVKTNANATSGQTDLKDAINAALASQGTTTANNIYAVYYGNETYLVRDADASKTLSSGDNLVKLAGLSNYDVLNGNVITDTDGVTKLLEITNS